MSCVSLIVWKEEDAGYFCFLFYQQYFQKPPDQFFKNLEFSGIRLPHCHIILTFNTCGKESFRKHGGKGENAGNQHFLLFPPFFLLYANTNFNFWVAIILSSANALNLVNDKILSFGKALIRFELIVKQVNS